MPVWRTQLDAARSHADASANNMLEAFSEIDGRLDQAIRITEAAQSDVAQLSVDDLVNQNQEALTQLLQPMRRALDSRDAVMRELEKVTVEAVGLREVANQVRQLAKRTGMVALNASVEASRAGASGSGFATVAQEVRQLAQQSGEAGARMVSLTARLETHLQVLNTQAAAHDGDDEALRAEADAGARAAISGLLRSLSEVNRSTRGLREAGQAVREQVERTLMGFQSQDRLNQMLGTIVEDIERMHAWLEQGGDLSQAQAIAWLERLESSYTMEDQRTVHHGQTSIERSSSVDFF
jgi:methyl-accepting chemotaxis protein